MIYTSESGKKLVVYDGKYDKTIGEVQKLLREGKIGQIGLKACICQKSKKISRSTPEITEENIINRSFFASKPMKNG